MHYRYGLKSISLILAAMFTASMFFTACKKDDDDFPDMEYPEETTAESTDDQSVPQNQESDIISITVASPYSSETIEYLAKLYYCKENDLFGENTGDTVSLSFLDGISPDFIVNSIVTSGEGLSLDNIIEMNNNGGVIDLFLTGHVDDSIQRDKIVPLNEYLSSNSLIASGKVYMSEMDKDTHNGLLYGIPFYSSVQLMIGNSDFIPDSGKIPFRYNTAKLIEYLTEIKNGYNCTPLYSGYDLMPYICSSFSDVDRCSFMLMDEYRVDPEGTMEVIGSELSFVNSLYGSRLSGDLTVSGSNPVFSRDAGMWVSSSSEISSWEAYYPSGIYFVGLPVADNARMIPIVNLYSLCVNKASPNQKFASEFAAFMALDTDARTLLERLEPMTGFLPSVKNQEVWNHVLADELFGQVANNYYQNMEDAVYCPDVSDSTYSSVIGYFDTYEGGEFDPEACYGYTR